MNRIAREREHDLRLAAQRTYSDAVAEAAKLYKAEKDAAYRKRDLGFDLLRNTRADLLSLKPRTSRIVEEIAEKEAAMREWTKTPPAVDLSDAEEARQRANKAADYRLEVELKSIRARVRSGELDSSE
jgi:hypothetical protein